MTDRDNVIAAIRGRLGAFEIDLELDAPGRGITAICGPSGAGKSTLLKAIAGLVRFDGATVRIGDKDWQSDGSFAPPHKRDIGFVFQDARLFSHLDVVSNLKFGLDRAPEPRRISMDQVCKLLDLHTLLARSVSTLSGGEQKRVAIGRALLAQPQLLLMDEALSGLDQDAKADILPRLRRIQQTLQLPMLYVTHDLREADILCDWLVLIEQGRISASGALADMQVDAALPLAGRPDACVTLPATLEALDADHGLGELDVDGGRFQIAVSGGEPGGTHRIRIGASDVSIALSRATDTTILNILPAQVKSLTPVANAQINVALSLGKTGEGATILARISRKSANELDLQPGCAVYAQVKSAALVGDAGD